MGFVPKISGSIFLTARTILVKTTGFYFFHMDVLMRRCSCLLYSGQIRPYHLCLMPYGPYTLHILLT